jgi:predicted metal-binding membrane protein
MSTSIAEAVARRDRIVVGAGLLGVALIAWAYILYLAASMRSMQAEMPTSMPPKMDMQMVMPNTLAWSTADFAFMFLMWAVMMIAMMTPSAAPMVLLFAQVLRQRHVQQNPFQATSAFLASYLLIWMVFSLVAAVVQFGLHSAALLSPTMVSTSPFLGGFLLIAAGVYQFTPLKRSCLSRCRTPLGFLLNEWREGALGAFVMGVRHGSYCVGCCWLLMALLFVAGVMNLLWVAAIALYILMEKTFPASQWLSRGLGVLMIGWGTLLIIGGIA